MGERVKSGQSRSESHFPTPIDCFSLGNHNSDMRKSLLIFISASFLLFSLPLVPGASAEEKCRNFNLNQIFSFGYNSDFPTWTSPGVNRVITWVALDSGELNGKKIQRSFGSQQQAWVREAFQSWDEALDSISFKEVSVGDASDIKIAWTQVLQLDYESLFQVKTAQPVRSNASIELKTGSVFLIFKENFIHVIQSDIGHILGMGYVTPSSDFESVMEWPFQPPYAQLPLGEFDVALVRSIYSESTCPSTFSPTIQEKMNGIAAAKVAEEIAAAEKLAAKLAAEKEAAAKVSAAKAAAAKAAAKAKIEALKKIVCEKGSNPRHLSPPNVPQGGLKQRVN